MEKVYKENEGKLESKGKPEDEVDTEYEGKSDGKERLEVEGKPEHEGKLQDQGQPHDEEKQEKQSKSQGEEKAHGEGKPESQLRAAEKRPTEEYVPQKAKQKTDRWTDDSLKDYQKDFQKRHFGIEERMRERRDVARAQEELRKRQKTGSFHWMQRDVQDSFFPRGQQGVRGVRGGGRGHKDFEVSPYI